MTNTPTPPKDQVLALRQWECHDSGHLWTVLEDKEGPARVLCTRCGRSHKVERG